MSSQFRQRGHLACKGARNRRQDPTMHVNHWFRKAMLVPNQCGHLVALPQSCAQPAVRAKGRFARGRTSKSDCILVRHVARIALHVHELVVPQQEDYLAAMLGRLILELEKQIIDLPGVASAIHNIARLNQHCLPTGPVPPLVHEPQRAQDFARVLQVAVQVAHGEEATRLVSLGQRSSTMASWTSQEVRSQASMERLGNEYCQEGSGSGGQITSTLATKHEMHTASSGGGTP
mmetsp:Transcript_55599/g.162537  ORF Transcript_55599/g.162537 Transcript_55599/m.162537 type:complete len:233 (-) Transcript_55599:7-705(-)